MSDAIAPLPRRWRILFLLELPLIFGTVGYWLLAPLDYLERALGSDPVANAHAVPLLLAHAGVVFSMVGWLYARLLLAPTVHVRSFRRVQEALLVGDLWIVVSALALAPAQYDPQVRATSATAAALALGWGIVRSVYLLRSR